MKKHIYILLCCLLPISMLASPPKNKMTTILKNIKTPLFSDHVYRITDFYTGKDSLYTDAINLAIRTCSESGGGTVLVPDGTFKTGPIRLLSNVNLHLSDHTLLRFTTDRRLFPIVLTRIEGIDCYNLSPLIYAYQAENLAITGKGKIDGGASCHNWLAEKRIHPVINGQKRNEKYILDSLLQAEAPMSQRHFTTASGYRPQTINFYQCRNILLQDFEINHSPFWLIHTLLSKNITLRRITLDSHLKNNDGFDPESCKDILIENCKFNTGDDCIAIKSGKEYDGRKWNIPSENIIVRNCTMKDGHAGIAIGSEITGGCHDVWMTNCTMSSPDLGRIVRIKSNLKHGGEVYNIYIDHIKVGICSLAILGIELKYWHTSSGPYPPYFHDIYLNNITCKGCRYILHIDGIKNKYMADRIYLQDCNFSGVKDKNINFIVGAKDISFTRVTVNGKKTNGRIL